MKIPKYLMIDDDLLPFLRSKGNMSEFVNSLIRASHDIEVAKTRPDDSVPWFNDEFKAIYQANKIKSDALYKKWLDERVTIVE